MTTDPTPGATRNNDGLVFTSRWGEPLYPDTVTALMTKLINRHNKNRPVRRPSCCRTPAYMICATCTRPHCKGAELHQMQHSAGRVNTHGLQRSVRPYGALSAPGRRRSRGDLGRHQPPGPGAITLHLMRLHDMHSRCI